MAKLKIPTLHCERCGHEWVPPAIRNQNVPEVQVALLGYPITEKKRSEEGEKGRGE
jgi:hypothetical protein